MLHRGTLNHPEVTAQIAWHFGSACLGDRPLSPAYTRGGCWQHGDATVDLREMLPVDPC